MSVYVYHYVFIHIISYTLGYTSIFSHVLVQEAKFCAEFAGALIPESHNSGEGVGAWEAFEWVMDFYRMGPPRYKLVHMPCLLPVTIVNLP